MCKIKKAVIREDLLAITNDYRRAIILNQFIYWSERVSDADKFIETENAVARSNNMEERDLFYGWIYKKSEELADEIMLGLSDRQVRRYVNELVEMGYLSKRRNPKYNWDRTLQYRVNLVNIAKALLEHGYPLSDYKIDLKPSDFSSGHGCPMERTHATIQTEADVQTIPDTTNRYYNTENNKYTSSGEDGSSFPLDDSENMKRLSAVAKDSLDGCADDFIDIALYFMESYRNKFGYCHRVMSYAACEKIVDQYKFPPETFHNKSTGWDSDDFKLTIDEYFSQGWKDGIVLSMSHYFSNGILGTLYERVCI